MLEIVSAGEFKTGWIDIRCMKQLQETGFKRTLTKLTELLNKPDEAIKHNLPEVAKFAGKIKMSETFETTLIIPADKDPSNILGIIDPKLNNQDQEKVYDFLKNIKIVNSHFSSDELTAVSSYVARQVLEKLAS